MNHDLLGWVLEYTHVGADGKPHRTRGRCLGAWGEHGHLTLALELDGGEVAVVSHTRSEHLRILPESRKVRL